MRLAYLRGRSTVLVSTVSRPRLDSTGYFEKMEFSEDFAVLCCAVLCIGWSAVHLWRSEFSCWCVAALERKLQ